MKNMNKMEANELNVISFVKFIVSRTHSRTNKVGNKRKTHKQINNEKY